MKIGVRAHDYGRHSIRDYAVLLHNEGYETVQLAIPKAFHEIETYEGITEEYLYQIREAFTENGIEIAVLGCYQDLGNPDEEIRKNAVETFKKSLKHAKILGARLTGSETSYAHLTKMQKHEWFPFMLDSLKRITEEAERINTWIGIEPVAWHPLEDVETTREVLDLLDSDCVKVIFDPANVLEKPALFDQKGYWEYCFSLLGEDIEAIHLKDFVVDDKGGYQAKLLGEGIMDYSVLKAWLAKKPGMAVLREEMNPQTAKADLAFMRGLVK